MGAVVVDGPAAGGGGADAPAAIDDAGPKGDTEGTDPTKDASGDVSISASEGVPPGVNRPPVSATGRPTSVSAEPAGRVPGWLLGTESASGAGRSSGGGVKAAPTSTGCIDWDIAARLAAAAAAFAIGD